MCYLITELSSLLIHAHICRFALKAKAKGDDAALQRVAADITTERLKLRTEVNVWRDDQALYMPDVLELASESTLGEREQLFLPSALSAALRKKPWYSRMSKYEMELRRGQADDVLANLRLALKYRDSLDRGRRKVACGNKNSTRANVLLRRVASLVQSRADTYRRARASMIRLGMSADDMAYPELLPEHVVLKRVFIEKDLGEGTYTGSWIWSNGPRGILSDAEEDEWEEEGLCLPWLQHLCAEFVFAGNKVEWFRARIDLRQWREEIEILDEELKRTAAWFKRMSSLWHSLAGQSSARGYSEYAHQKAVMFARRSEETVEHHSKALTAELDVKGKRKASDCTFSLC